MDAEKINLFITTKGDYFPSKSIPIIRQRLEALPNERESVISAIGFKSPKTALLLSMFLGWLGIDRVYTGYYFVGAMQFCMTLLSFVFWISGTTIIIWWFLDIFFIMRDTKKKNLQKLDQILLIVG